jgi:hypothetical protein
MNRIGKLVIPTVFVAFALAGCHSNQPQPVSSDDPATANLANASNTSSDNPPPPPSDQGSGAAPSDGQYGGGEPPADYSDTAYDVASDPPPALPDYDQPECPGDDYIWTPGYWSYASAGYYWVPGEWVMAPYVGALWTPGYWGYDGGHYHWYHGYWGPHIGFYGGVNYGFGYDGNGYEGGYWRSNNFYYNTAVSHVNETVIHNVYNYRVNINNNTRVSYNGGSGGLNYRPTPAQTAARNERHVAPLPVQRTIAQTAMQNKAQFASANHGRPQTVAESRPASDGRSAPAPRAEDFHPAPAARPEAGTPAPAPGMRPAPGVGTRPQPNRPAPEARPAAGNRPAPGSRPAAGAQTPARPESRPATPPRNQPRPESRPAPTQQSSRPAPTQQSSRPEARPQPEGRPAPQSVARPQPQSEPKPETRPQPESRPAAPPKQESRPAPPPKQEQKPENKPGDKHPQV